MIRNKRCLPKEFEFKPLYNIRLEVPPGKMANLKNLTQYLKKEEAKTFYNNLLLAPQQSATISDIDEDDNSSGISDDD